MRIAQIVLPDAPLYERKSQRIDAAALAAAHEVSVIPSVSEEPGRPSGAAHPPSSLATLGMTGFDLAHVYGPRALPRLRLDIPFIASGVNKRRWWQRSVAQPRYSVAPVENEFTLLPEAVEDEFFSVAASGVMVGSILRPSVKNATEQTRYRLSRTRDDIEWQLFDALPSPAEMSNIGVWIDPAIDDHDYDGGTAEALAAGCVVVASRTPINRKRCEEGRTALLVRANDPNEMTHAILSALFKPESGQQRAVAARQTIGKFRVRHRLRVLAQMYEMLLE